MRAVGQSILFHYEESRSTEGGIYIPQGMDVSGSTSLLVTVISVGSLVQHVKEGDKVLIPKLMKTPVDMEKGIYSTLEHQVLAIIDG